MPVETIEFSAAVLASIARVSGVLGDAFWEMLHRAQ